MDPATGAVTVTRDRTLPYVPTPVATRDAAGDVLHLWGDRGIVVALDAATGGELWATRVPGGNFSASPVVVGDVLVNVSESGTVVTLPAGRAAPPGVAAAAGTSELGGRVFASPAVVADPDRAGGRAYFRTETRLLCLPLARAGE